MSDVEKLQVAENTPKKDVAKISKKSNLYPMKRKKSAIPAKVTFTPSPEDFAIIQKGQQKHGIKITEVLRMALRRFAESEGLNLKAS
jgi:hypothetical protein